MSLKSQYTRSSYIEESSIGSIDNTTESKSICSDMQSSYGSLDAEFLQSLKRMPRRKARPSRSVRRQNYRKLVRNLALALGAMLIRYLMVHNLGTTSVIPNESGNGHGNAFGLFGSIQVILAFVAFVKIQRYVQGKTNVQRCPFCRVFLAIASSRSRRLKGD